MQSTSLWRRCHKRLLQCKIKHFLKYTLDKAGQLTNSWPRKKYCACRLFLRINDIQKSSSWISVTNHLHGTKEFHVRVVYFFSCLAYSVHHKSISLCQMIDNSINHMVHDLEGILKSSVRKWRDFTNPVVENTFFSSYIIIFYACPSLLIWLRKALLASLISYLGMET